MVGNYPVITLCGSTRFKKAFIEAQKRLTLEGYIVISVGLFGHSGDDEVWENMPENTVTRTKAMLDDMHKRKIDMADEIYVLNVNDYIGQSTQSEIAYARAHGKIVRFLEPHVEGVREDDAEQLFDAHIESLWGPEVREEMRQSRGRALSSLDARIQSMLQESSSAHDDDADTEDDDYAALEAVMRQAVQGVGVSGVVSPEDATAAMIAYQNGEDDIDPDDMGPQSMTAAFAEARRAARRDEAYGRHGHVYAVDVSEDDEEQDPIAAKAAYALQMLQDGYDIGNTAYFIGEDEAFVRAVMLQNGITDEDLIRFAQQ